VLVGNGRHSASPPVCPAEDGTLVPRPLASIRIVADAVVPLMGLPASQSLANSDR